MEHDIIREGVDDPALLRAQRWAEIRDLRARITGLESDAVEQDDLANQLEGMGNGKPDTISKSFHAMAGSEQSSFKPQSIAPKPPACANNWPSSNQTPATP